MVHALHDYARPDGETDVGARRQSELSRRAARTARVAAIYADDVDRSGRFPAEAIASLKEERLLAAMAPPEFGGEGASISDTMEVCYRLGRSCAATAMIFAMHQTMVACLVKFGRGNLWQEGMLRRLVREQLVIASSTTEGARGGDLRSSEAPIEQDGLRIRLAREVSCISYGEDADCILTVARRSPDAAATQQVLVVFPRESYSLVKRQAWDTLGMRGTCSAGYLLDAQGVPDQMLAEPFDRINARCMMPVAHILWSSAWTGIAAAALERARSSVMKSMRAANGKPPSGLALLTRASAHLETLRSRVMTTAAHFAEASANERDLDSVEFQTLVNLLKVEASEQALSIAMTALRICGLSGYRNDTEFSVGRHVRDLASAPLMISNDRIIANMGSHALLCDIPETLAF